MAGHEAEFEHDVDSALVTGATGNVGRWVVDRLANRGVEVVGVDREQPPGTRANAEFRALDLTEQGPTWETVQDVAPDVVVHLAAIADPIRNPGTRVFTNNVTSTYHVLDAAGRAGIDVVATSSQAAYGALFADGEWVPDYLPIDEAHDRRPADSYGLSKLCSEEIAAAASRKYGITAAIIRPASIFSPDHSRARPPRDSSDLSSEEHAGDFGAYVDVRDLARMVEAALAADLDGHDSFLCVADENYLGQSTVELVEAICGHRPASVDLDGRESALSNAKAERVLGWTPRYSWVGETPADDDVPTWV